MLKCIRSPSPFIFLNVASVKSIHIEDKSNGRINQTPTDNSKVFIVHGHNIAVQQEVARVIERLKLVPVILSEQANAGRTIIEKFEQNADVGFAAVLLTTDDVGNSANSTGPPKTRARQNVVLELGYFIEN